MFGYCYMRKIYNFTDHIDVPTWVMLIYMGHTAGLTESVGSNVSIGSRLENTGTLMRLTPNSLSIGCAICYQAGKKKKNQRTSFPALHNYSIVCCTSYLFFETNAPPITKLLREIHDDMIFLVAC